MNSNINKAHSNVCDYNFFKEVIEYCNKNWRCYLTDTEIAKTTSEFKNYFEESLKTGNILHEILSFLERLDEDDCEESLHYANMMRYELKQNTVEK